VKTRIAPLRLGIERQLRVIGLLDGADEVGLTPLATLELHTLAYLSDALAPVWGLPLVDAQILKGRRPYFPSLQRDIDQLVGLGVIAVAGATYIQAGAQWQVDARFSLHREYADPILNAVRQYENRTRELEFVREVVFAASALGREGIADATSVDAAYGDPVVGEGGVIDLADEQGNATADVARRFAALTGQETSVSPAAMLHLYVRHLFMRLERE